jgi:LPXTG-motif cell wall-anchored protein
MSIAHRLTMRTAVVVAALIGAAMLAMSLAPAANAASAYRFWGYFQLTNGKWTFSQKGADQTKPADGSVEGWRFALAAQTDTRTPRGTVEFKDVCSSKLDKKGFKRVAVVIDYGRGADAGSTEAPMPPIATCAQVPTDATGAQVLAKVAEVRTEKGMTCGVDEWPATGCGGAVRNVSAAAKARDSRVPITIEHRAPAYGTAWPTDSPQQTETQAADTPAAKDEESSNTPLLIGGVVVVLLAGGALVSAQRRRKNVESA